MKLGAAIAEIMKREGIEILCGYPVNHLIEYAANADIRPVMVRQERIGVHMADAISRVTSGHDDRRVLHAARARRRERHGRRGAVLRRVRPGAGAADGLCAPARQYRPELQLQPGDEGVLEIVRADQHRGRSLQHLPPRLHQAEERPRRARDRRDPGRHVERGGAGAAELHAGAAHAATAPIPCRCEEAAALLVNAKRPVIYAGQGVHYAKAWPQLEAARRAARDPRHHQPWRQVVLSGNASAVAGLGRPRGAARGAEIPRATPT